MLHFNIIILSVFLLLTSCRKDDPNKPKGSANTIPIYNQAYQENWEADQLGDIIVNAHNGYVLIDPFENNAHTQIAAIKANGNEVGGYISIGTGEDWRADYNDLKPYLVTKQWSKWKGEYFVNETTTGILDVMKIRIDKMADWGCDWVEFDNMDWMYDDKNRNKYKFGTTAAQGEAYFNELCDYVHQKGMKCMAKNHVINAGHFDGVLYESYKRDKDWWDHAGAQRFLDAGKLVIVNHYKEYRCNKVYQEYIDLYNDDICFICESAKAKKYIHYNE